MQLASVQCGASGDERHSCMWESGRRPFSFFHGWESYCSESLKVWSHLKARRNGREMGEGQGEWQRRRKSRRRDAHYWAGYLWATEPPPLCRLYEDAQSVLRRCPHRGTTTCPYLQALWVLAERALGQKGGGARLKWEPTVCTNLSTTAGLTQEVAGPWDVWGKSTCYALPGIWGVRGLPPPPQGEKSQEIRWALREPIFSNSGGERTLHQGRSKEDWMGWGILFFTLCHQAGAIRNKHFLSPDPDRPMPVIWRWAERESCPLPCSGLVREDAR